MVVISMAILRVFIYDLHVKDSFVCTSFDSKYKSLSLYGNEFDVNSITVLLYCLSLYTNYIVLLVLYVPVLHTVLEYHASWTTS